ncbi:hypothetical protein L2Z53_12150 (plasmid) [Macrococcoides canis]|uniref:hypothetical protein n=1 Tax=Macrococcoides canis TaxID=1855823 RepID=UPI001F3EF298|nr:hypothetical protein [Macrococcus canis]UJS29006.1 hypothetical protein L2Z53_12150 [Macrococcus canis]
MIKVVQDFFEINKQLFKYIPFTSTIFLIILIVLYTDKDLIKNLDITNIVPISLQELLLHLANTVYSPINILFFIFSLLTISIVISHFPKLLSVLTKSQVIRNSDNKIKRVRYYHEMNIISRFFSIINYILNTLFILYFTIKILFEKEEFYKNLIPFYSVDTNNLFSLHNGYLIVLNLLFIFNVLKALIDVSRAFMINEINKINDKAEIAVDIESIDDLSISRRYKYAEIIAEKKEKLNNDDVSLYLLRLKQFDPVLYYITFERIFYYKDDNNNSKVNKHHFILLKFDSFEEATYSFDNVENIEHIRKIITDYLDEKKS